MKWKSNGAKRKCVLKKDYLYYVPIIQTLQTLLNNRSVLLEVLNFHHNKLHKYYNIYVYVGGTGTQIIF